MAKLDEILSWAHQRNASDLHLQVGSRPWFRTHGEMAELQHYDPLSRDRMIYLLTEILTPAQIEQFRKSRELDFTYGTEELGRFRCNYFHDWRGPAAAFRSIDAFAPTFEGLNLPDAVEALAHLKRGLLLATGTSGAGKTSTAAAILNTINQTYCRHVVTLEDPIEYVHTHQKSVIHQRGRHHDFDDLEAGIRSALAQDVDVLFIGEMRDAECIRLAVHAAETGCLVVATLHANGAVDAISRIIDVFPRDEQTRMRSAVSQALAGCIYQVLVSARGDARRLPAVEVLRVTSGVANLIRDDKLPEVTSQLQSGRKNGMITLDDSLQRLVDEDLIDEAQAYLNANNKDRFAASALIG